MDKLGRTGDGIIISEKGETEGPERGVRPSQAEAPWQSWPEPHREPPEAGGQSQTMARAPVPRNTKGPGGEPPAPLSVGATEELLFTA